jgi:hypothetical protein
MLSALRARVSPSTAPTLLIPFAVCAVAGLLLGGLTLLLQGILPGVFNHLANSGAVWSVGAFVAGALLVYRQAPGALVPLTPAIGHARGQWIPVIAGLLVEVGAVIGYYTSTITFNGDDVSAAALRGPLVWIVVAFLAGPLYGLAGAAYRGTRHRERVAATALLGTVFVAEAGYLLAVLHYGGEALLMAIIGLAVPVALGRTAQERLHGLLVVLVLIPLGLLAMWLLSLGVDMAFTA